MLSFGVMNIWNLHKVNLIKLFKYIHSVRGSVKERDWAEASWERGWAGPGALPAGRWHRLQVCVAPTGSRTYLCNVYLFSSFDITLYLYIWQLIEIYSLEITSCEYRKNTFVYYCCKHRDISVFIFPSDILFSSKLCGKIKMHCYHCIDSYPFII